MHQHNTSAKTPYLSRVNLLHVPALLGHCQAASFTYKERCTKINYSAPCINTTLLHTQV